MASRSGAAPRGMWPWLVLALGILVADQASKLLVASHFSPGDTTYVTGFFNLTRMHNEGAAFSFLAGASGWQRWFFTGIGLVAAVFILGMLRKHAQHRWMAFALACILGGAVGNVVDRVAYGHVVDFLQFHFEFLKFAFPGGYFPSFNVADSAITIGAATLVLDEFLRMRRTRQGTD